MDIRQITPDYSVSPQVEAADMAALAAAGFTDIICNRPDAEVPPDQSAAVIAAAAREAGMSFHDNPVSHSGLQPGQIERQRDVAAAAAGPVFAYCRTGTRSTIIWALGQVGQRPAGDIVAMAAEAGYDIAGLRPQLEAMAEAN